MRLGQAAISQGEVPEEGETDGSHVLFKAGAKDRLNLAGRPAGRVEGDHAEEREVGIAGEEAQVVVTQHGGALLGVVNLFVR
jgi:hypothetical protein